MPKRFMIVPRSCTVAPNTPAEQTTWSPALSRPITHDRIADMPDEVATQHSAPSSAASRSSNTFTVGIGEARIDVARLLVAEARRRLRRALEDEARGEIQRLGMLAELAALDAGAHRQRFQLVFVVMYRWRVSHKQKTRSASTLNRVSLALAVFITRPQADHQIGAHAS